MEEEEAGYSHSTSLLCMGDCRKSNMKCKSIHYQPW